MATSPHSNPEVAGSSLARSQCPYDSGFTPRLRFARWRSARWDHIGDWEDRGIFPLLSLKKLKRWTSYNFKQWANFVIFQDK
ncbi:hypothetical protein Hanom_Chr07g00606381 [Helianthus anomalus]